MILALYILLALVGTGLVLWWLDRRGRSRRAADDSGEAAPDVADDTAADDGCCGMHITCEKDSLLASVSPGIEYFDDEELDAYAGRPADGYTDEETEQFRDVLLTLRPDDIAAWGRSVQLRGITLPAVVREELLMIVSEARASRAQSHD